MNTPDLTRRLALAFGALWPFATTAAAERNAVDALRARADAANDAFMRGDMRRWFDLIGPIADDFTLMQPFGGPTSHGFDASPERLDRMAAYFQSGDASLELIEAYASPDMVVLVMIERQTGEVGGLPRQDWSLRVTQIYQRRDSAWALVHRHADPLVRYVGRDTAAALARGDFEVAQ